MRPLGWAGLAAGILLCAAAPLAAQSPELERVAQLSDLGRTEEARTVLLEWWDAARDDSSRRDLQWGLWLRGRLTVDPVQAELDFQRLVVLYPSGPYTPQALFRLAQSAYAQGDTDGAGRHVTTLSRDYPNSPTRAEAEAWLQAAGVAPAPPDASAGPRQSAQATGTPPPTQNAPAGIRPSLGASTAPADEILNWFVQFGAFADEERAFALHQELVTAGLAARLVRVAGSGFVHVRVGRFSDRIDANAELEEVVDRGFTAAVVMDDRPEEVVRR